MEAAAIAVWVCLALIVALIAAVIVLFIIKPSKSKVGDHGPQGFQGNIGRQGSGQGFQGEIGPVGPRGDRGFQGETGGPPIDVHQLPVTIAFKRIANIAFRDNLTDTRYTGIQTLIEPMLTYQFSNVAVVMKAPFTFDFFFEITIPSKFVLPTVNAVQYFSGICATNRQQGTNPTSLYLHSVEQQPTSPNVFRLRYLSQDGNIWNNDGGGTNTPLLYCNFTITFALSS